MISLYYIILQVRDIIAILTNKLQITSKTIQWARKENLLGGGGRPKMIHKTKSIFNQLK